MPRSGPDVSAKKPPARYDCDGGCGCSSSPARGLFRREGCQCPLSSLGSWRTHPNPWPGIDRRHRRSSFSPLIYFELCARDGFSSPFVRLSKASRFLPQINHKKERKHRSLSDGPVLIPPPHVRALYSSCVFCLASWRCSGWACSARTRPC